MRRLRMVKTKIKSYKKAQKSIFEKYPVGLTFRASVIIFTFALGLLYLLQVNDTATKGYVIRDLESQVQALEERKASLEVYAARMQSLARIQKAIKGKDLVASKDIQYVSTSSAVAINE